jgi:Protein of unknown function (DUF2911)
MKKFLLVLGVILIIILGVLTYFRVFYTKSFSPEDEVTFTNGDLKVKVFYNRPYKKGRVIFGELVPYGKVWRTGANEATIFETNKDLNFADKTLKAGKYSFFTIPGEQAWSIIFNTETGQWGVGFNGEANRNPAKDAFTLDVPSVLQEKEFEQFTISIEKAGEEMELILMWDKTLVSVPFTLK